MSLSKCLQNNEGRQDCSVQKNRLLFQRMRLGLGTLACQGAIRTIYMGTDDTVLPLKTFVSP